MAASVTDGVKFLPTQIAKAIPTSENGMADSTKMAMTPV